MPNLNRVHEEWDCILVDSNHGQEANYRVFYGAVNWNKSAGGMHPAVTVLMQYGSTLDWADAKSEGEIDFTMPAHILREDIHSVLEAIRSLAEKHDFEI